MHNILNVIAPFPHKKAQKPHFSEIPPVYFPFFFRRSFFSSSISAFLRLMISLLRLSVDKNPSMPLSFSNAALRFSNLARCLVPFSPASFSCPVSFRIHGVRNSSLSPALTIIRPSNASFSTNRMLILFPVLSTWMS